MKINKLSNQKISNIFSKSFKNTNSRSMSPSEIDREIKTVIEFLEKFVDETKSKANTIKDDTPSNVDTIKKYDYFRSRSIVKKNSKSRTKKNSNNKLKSKQFFHNNGITMEFERVSQRNTTVKGGLLHILKTLKTK